jgi:hypothetical protein
VSQVIAVLAARRGRFRSLSSPPHPCVGGRLKRLCAQSLGRSTDVGLALCTGLRCSACALAFQPVVVRCLLGLRRALSSGSPLLLRSAEGSVGNLLPQPQAGGRSEASLGRLPLSATSSSPRLVEPAPSLRRRAGFCVQPVVRPALSWGGGLAANNAMNLTNRGVTVSRSGAPSGEPVLAEVGAPVILSLGVAGYCSVSRLQERCG